MTQVRERSQGHIAFVPSTHGDRWEYWERDGSIWRQIESAPVMPDGFRSGRWYAYTKPEVCESLRRVVRRYAPHQDDLA
jgi:hypothetical protein